MWFSPLKGANLTLGQLDKTLPVDGSVVANKSIERGSIVYVKAGATAGAAPTFELYGDTQAASPTAVPYVALQGFDDYTAGMAGNIGQAPVAGGGAVGTAATGSDLAWLNVPAGSVAGPKITALCLLQTGEFQTSAFDATQTYAVGDALTVSAGKLTPFVEGTNIVGYVTAAPTVRRVNDLGAASAGARISGGNVQVIEFVSAWIPAAAAADAEVSL